MAFKVSVFIILVLILTFVILASCDAQKNTPSTSVNGLLLPMSTDAGPNICTECVQATQAAELTQAKSSTSANEAATAEIMRINAKSTLNSVGATLGAAQVQAQSKANSVAAQMASTAEIIRANAQATMIAADSTQNVVLTQNAIRQTEAQINAQMTDSMATQYAISAETQQTYNLFVSETQNSVAAGFASQTQSAIATSQWYSEQERQREVQIRGPLAILWVWCPGLLILIFILVGAYSFLRWMIIQKDDQINDPELLVPVVLEPILINDNAKPNDDIDLWLDEVKRKLIADKKDNDDNQDQ